MGEDQFANGGTLQNLLLQAGDNEDDDDVENDHKADLVDTKDPSKEAEWRMTGVSAETCCELKIPKNQ